MGRLARFIHFYTDEDDGADIGPTNIVSGNPPLALVNAIAKKIRRLIQIGKCTVSGTDITCNNGVLKYGATGKNILNPAISRIADAGSFVQSGVTVTYNADGSFRLQAEESTRVDIVVYSWNQAPLVFPEGTYTFSVEGNEGHENYIHICASGAGEGYNGAAYFDVQKSATVTVQDGSKSWNYFFFRIFAGDAFDVTLRLQAEQGSTATPYEPYTEGFYTEGTPEEIRVTGKNLFDVTERVTGQTDANGNTSSGYSLSGDTIIISKDASTYGRVMLSAMSMKSGSYVLSFKASISGSGRVWCSVRDMGADQKADIVNPSGKTAGEITIPFSLAEDADVAVSIQPESNAVGTVTISDIQLELGSTATEYAPFHQETATASNLFAVGSVTDEQDIISGTITRRCEAVVSDGTTPSGRYIGTVGEGNILVCAKETGYSGAIASFTADKAEPLSGLVAEIEPVQDLHGQSSPYPAGGGVNKLPPMPDGTDTIGGLTVVASNGILTVSGSTSEGRFLKDYTLTATHVIQSGEYLHCGNSVASSVAVVGLNFSDSTRTEATISGINRVFDLADFVGKTITQLRFYCAAGATFNGTVAPMIASSSTAVTWQPYANECPISGHTGLSGQRLGKNLLNPSTRTISNGTMYWYQTSGFELKANQPYTFSLTGDYTPNGLYIRKLSDASSLKTAYLSKVISYTPTEDITVYFHALYNAQDRPTDEQLATMLAQLEVGSTASTYEEYTGEAISVSWQSEAGTVYSGTLDVVSGELVAEWADVDLTKLNWSQNTNSVFTAIVPNIYGRKLGEENEALCSKYASQNVWYGDVMSDGKFMIRGDIGRVYIRDTTYTVTTEFRDSLADVQFVYKLATPITYHLTPTEISTLVGQNNVWVDTGNVSAYVPDFTTEKVAGQSLSTADGTNTVFVTSNVDPVEIEVEYRTP